MPASRLSWLVSLLTCDVNGANCVTRRSDPYTGSGGSVVAPDWSGEGNNYLEFKLTATDSKGLSDVKAVRLVPLTVPLTFTSSPPGLSLAVASDTKVTPFTRTVIVGSQNSLGALTPQSLNGSTYTFASWSDGGAGSHVVAAPTTATTYNATYNLAPVQGLVASYGFDEGTGTATADSSGYTNNGVASNTTWNATGKYGKALTFNGSSSSVGVADAASLDLSTAMTVEAWVNPAANTGWRTVLLKENPARPDLTYALYGATPSRGAGGWTVTGATNVISAAENATRLALNTWTHVAATYDGTNLRLYQNGTLISTVAATGAMANGAGPLKIGGNSIWGEWFQGSIDEVRVYNRALSATEITTDLNTPVTNDRQVPSAPGTLTATGGLGKVNLSWGAATDNVGVVRYNVHRGTTPGFTPTAANRVAQPTATTYQDTVAAGTYYYRVTAEDAAANVGPPTNEASGASAADLPPSAPGALSAVGALGRVNLSWGAATDDVGVARYNVYRGTTPGFTPTAANRVAQPTATTYQDNVAAGTYYYRVIAEDTANQSGPASNEASGTATADTVVPTVGFTAPAPAATVAGSVAVSANSSDNVAVIGVQFKVDGVNVGAEDATSPYGITWDSRTVSNGAHTLTAVSRDAAGNTATASVAVTVNNTASTGLVAAYGFNEGTGTATADSSGLANNGTAANATWNATGKYGKALSFNGTSSVVSVPDSASLDLTTGVTLEAWVNPTVNTGWRSLVLKENPARPDLTYALYGATPTRGAGAWVVTGANNVTSSAENTARLTVNTWTHVAMTYDGANLRFYQNGTLVTTKATTGAMAVTAGALKIGGDSIWGEWFQGSLDEVRVYNRALTAAEITTDLNTAI